MDTNDIARELIRWGRVGKRLPKGSLIHRGETYPVLFTNGVRAGSILPGVGVALDVDLKTLGITKPVPNVIERTPWVRTLERCLETKGAITSMSDVLAMVQQNSQICTKTTRFVANGTGFFQQDFDTADSGIHFSSFIGGGGIITAAPSNVSLIGAYNASMQNPPSGKKKYLLSFAGQFIGAVNTTVGMGVYVDMLSIIGGLASNTTSLQSFSSAALTRCTNGEGVLFSVCVSDQLTTGYGGAGTTMTVGYTNQAGTSGRSSAMLTVDAGQSTMYTLFDGSLFTPLINFPFQSGDWGARSIQSLQLSVASVAGGGATALGIMMFKPLLFMHAITENGTIFERDVRAEPEILCELPVDGSNVLGYHTFLWELATSANNYTPTFTIRSGDG